MNKLDEARDHVLGQYGQDIGKRREELLTPAPAPARWSRPGR